MRPFALLVGLLALGCGDPLLERQTITNLRVLGARYEADDDPGRATPLAGEGARVRWLVAGPGGPLDVSFHLAACAAREQVRGVPTCQETPLAEVKGRGLEPELTLVVPAAARLLVRAAFCSEGTAELGADFSVSGCASAAADQEFATYELHVAADDADIHRHPSLDGATLLLNGALWDDDECVAAGATATVALTLSETARDLRPTADPAGPWETLQISHLSTTGRFARPFTVIPGDSEDLTASVDWEAPATPGVAHVYLVVRDLRGGISWITRSLCVR